MHMSYVIMRYQLPVLCIFVNFSSTTYGVHVRVHIQAISSVTNKGRIICSCMKMHLGRVNLFDAKVGMLH